MIRSKTRLNQTALELSLAQIFSPLLQEMLCSWYVRIIVWMLVAISQMFCANVDSSASCLQVGGPYWDVPLGRKDSKTASFALANTNIPTPDGGLLSIISKFLYQGLSVTDTVALAGKSPLFDRGTSLSKARHHACLLRLKALNSDWEIYNFIICRSTHYRRGTL